MELLNQMDGFDQNTNVKVRHYMPGCSVVSPRRPSQTDCRCHRIFCIFCLLRQHQIKCACANLGMDSLFRRAPWLPASNPVWSCE